MYRLLELASQFIALKYDYTFHKINKYWMLFLIPLSAFPYTAIGLSLYRYRPFLIPLSAFPAFPYTAEFFPIFSQLVIYRSIIENFRGQCTYMLNKTNRF
jgi:hypothetical protein